jgi:hypothetical protein
MPDKKDSHAPAKVARIPLKIKGAYAIAPPAEDFDIAKATPAELASHGFSWAVQHPTALAELRRLATGKKMKWVRPELKVKKGKIHVRRPQGQLGNANAPLNTNWSGGVVFANGAPALPLPGVRIDAYSTEFNSQQHINIVRSDGHVCEFVYGGGGWSLNDLTQLAGAPAAVANSALDGYPTNFNEQQHVNYIGTDNHVHELFYEGGRWQHNDLTVQAKASNASSIVALAGYATQFNEQQHVICIGPNNHIVELVYAGSWRQNDLTSLAGAGNFPAANGSIIDGYVTNFNQQQHINYVGFNGHVHELVYDGSWKHNDLTQITGAPAAAPGSGLDGYSTEFNRQQHVNFIGTDGSVHELVYDGSWKHNNLTQLTGAPGARVGAGLDGYATNYNGQQHVNYVGLDSQVHELVYDGSWKHNNLGTAAGSSTTFVGPGSALVGYATEYNGQQHVIYIGADTHVEELFYTSQWNFNDLSVTTAHGAVADAWIFCMGMWKVPAVSKPDFASGAGGGWDSSSWVGIDGENSNDVLQAGVEQEFDGDSANYTAWYEWYAPRRDGSPGYIDQTNISNFPVSAGDSMWCIVQYIENRTRGSIFIANLSNGSFTSLELDPPPGASFEGNCIEWIMETPTIDGQYSALPAFTEVVFTAATGLNVSNVSGNPSSGTVQTIYRNDTALTSTRLSNDTVTIDYLPWHALDLTLEAPGPTAGPAGALDGYATAFNKQLHVNYIGSDAHVNELIYDGSWKHNDLTVLGGAPNAVDGNALDGYSTEFNQQQHVNFIGADQHVHEIYYDSGWKHNDLSTLGGAPVLARASSPVDGYVTNFNQQQHVNFIGTDGHLHELVYDGSWKHNDLTALGGAPTAAGGSSLDGYSTEFNRQQHVNFIGTDGHVHELVYDGSWKHNDLSQLGGAPVAALANGPLSGYVTGFNKQQHVIFIGTDNRVYELVYQNSWQHTDLLAAAGVSNLLAGAASRLDGYSTEFNEQQHVNFVGSDGHLHELWYSSKWQHNDLTLMSGSAVPLVGSSLAGYASGFNEQEHVMFLDSGRRVIELMY